MIGGVGLMCHGTLHSKCGYIIKSGDKKWRCPCKCHAERTAREREAYEARKRTES